MKKYIREVLSDLKRPKTNRDFIPEAPKAPTDAATVELTPPPEPVIPNDLENQELSLDPLIRLQQLEQQAQDAEIRETEE
jgi:hypothetical protein